MTKNKTARRGHGLNHFVSKSSSRVARGNGVVEALRESLRCFLVCRATLAGVTNGKSAGREATGLSCQLFQFPSDKSVSVQKPELN